jgi:hypothetical protein
MSFEINPVDAARAARIGLDRPSGPTAPTGAPGAGFSRALAAGAAAHVDAIPASPPREVIDEMLAAQRAVDDMHRRGRELHFNMDSGRLRIELRDLDGNVLKLIPGTRALEIATGRAVE